MRMEYSSPAPMLKMSSWRFSGQIPKNMDEIVHRHKFPLLIPVAPEHDCLAEFLAADDLADKVKNEMHLATVGVITRPVERRRHRA